jgi:hypothetical protein
VAFVKATHSIGGQDVAEEYLACRIFPLSVSFSLGEIVDGETLVSKLIVPLPESPVARLLEEMNDGFRVRVEVAAVNVVGRYARGEHDACIGVVPNEGRMNRVFEKIGVPYGPCLVPSSKASKETVKKRIDAGARPVGKHAKVSGQKVKPPKATMTPKSIEVASSKAALVKATHAKTVPKASVAPRASVPLGARTPSRTVVSKATTTVTTTKGWVLRINTRAKRQSAAPSPAAKGKQARFDVTPPPAFTVTCKTMVQPWASGESDDGRVAHCWMLDSVPYVEMCSSLLSDSSSESIRASPPPFLNIPKMPDAKAAQRAVPVKMEARTVSPIGEFSCFCMFHMFCDAFANYVDFGVGCADGYDGDIADASLRQMVQGQSSTSTVGGDDEQIIQCLEHVRARFILPILCVYDIVM